MFKTLNTVHSSLIAIPPYRYTAIYPRAIYPLSKYRATIQPIECDRFTANLAEECGESAGLRTQPDGHQVEEDTVGRRRIGSRAWEHRRTGCAGGYRSLRRRRTDRLVRRMPDLRSQLDEC